MVFLRDGKKYALTEGDGEVENGGGGCRRNVWSFAMSFGLAALVTNSLTIYVTSQVTALQKQYDWSSTMVGGLLSCNDIGFLSAVLLVSHLGHTCHIPRLLGLATLLFGVSGLLSAMTYFLQPASLQLLDANASLPSPSLTGRLCLPGQGTGTGKSCGEGEAESGGNTLVLVLLGLSMVLQGVAKAPRVSLSTTYVDDSTGDKARTPLYMGVIMTLSLFGPPIAIFLGGLFRKLPVDLRETVLTPTHPDWIGCWWLGFLVFGLAALLVAIPLFLFPRSMRKPQSQPEAFTLANSESKVKVAEVKDDGEKVKDAVDSGDGKTESEKAPPKETPKQSIWRRLKDLPMSLLRMHREPIYALTLWGIVLIKFGISGEISFGPKYVEHQFQLPAFKANLVLGIKKIIGVTLGTFLGGLLTSRLRLDRVGCLKFLVMTKFISVSIKSFGFYFGCSNPIIHGLDLQGAASAKQLGDFGCDCSGSRYFPVCGDNTTSFFSPCFAACTNSSSTVYAGCGMTDSGEVTPGLCESDCPWLYYYLSAELVGSLMGTLGIMPAFITIIRSVEEGDRSIAMGLTTFLTSLLSYLPAPLVFGHVIDSTCLVWGQKCGRRGACALYDVVSQRFRYKGLVVGLYGSGLLLFIVALLVAIRQAKNAKGTEQTCVVSKTTEENGAVTKGAEGNGTVSKATTKV